MQRPSWKAEAGFRRCAGRYWQYRI